MSESVNKENEKKKASDDKKGDLEDVRDRIDRRQGFGIVERWIWDGGDVM